MATQTVPTGQMPIGQDTSIVIRSEQVTITKGNQEAPVFNDEAAATIVWQNYQRARSFLENDTWLLNWQEEDILYQSPSYSRIANNEGGRPARVSRFLVAKNTNTMSRQVKRALFAEQVPFFLRPRGKTTQEMVDAWTALLTVLLERMNFQYFSGLLIDCQTLHGTGIGKLGWDEKKVVKYGRKRKTPPSQVEMPVTGKEEIPTEASDEFEPDEREVTESWPFFEYRRLGTTMFDPRWSTPNRPDLSGSYVIDVDYVTFADLQEMRLLDCYKNIPSEEVLKRWFIEAPVGSAPQGSQVEDDFTAQGSAVEHAEGRNRQTDENPLEKPLLMIEQWDDRTVKTMLVYEDRKLIIRNEDPKLGSNCHVSANWWSIENSGYGMGIGRMNGGDQRINQGVLNESLKMIAYPMNAPLITARGDNAPTQNVIWRMGGFHAVDVPPGGDVMRAIGFLPMPAVPADAWRMIEMSQKSSEDVSGASGPFAQGNLGGPGSSAARTATGAGAISSKSQENISDPVTNFAEGVIVPTIRFLVHMVKTKMPVAEIRQILNDKMAGLVITAIYEEQFLSSEFDIAVLAGQKLAAKAGIQQMIPLFMQMVQQPQLLEYLHQRGETIDFGVMIDLMMQISELQEQPDIVRPLTEQEKEMIQQMNPATNRVQGATEIEQVRGQNKIAEIHAKSQDELGNKIAEAALEKTGNGIPLERATGLVERGNDEAALRGGGFGGMTP